MHRPVVLTLSFVFALAFAARVVAVAVPRGERDLLLEPRSPSHRGAPAPGRLLVASRQLVSPVFGRSVILLLEHDDGGTLGLIVNRPTKIELREAIPELAKRSDRAWFGGPVELGGVFLLIRADEPPAGARPVLAGVHASRNPDTLRAVIDASDSVFRAYVGYAGWAAHQLAHELARGDWVVATANAETVFAADPDEVWPDLIEQSEGLEVRRPEVTRPSLALLERSAPRAVPEGR